jgi:beta-galactosidase/beta-glucuronidase
MVYFDKIKIMFDSYTINNQKFQLMKKLIRFLIFSFLILFSSSLLGQTQKVAIKSSLNGHTLMVDGKPFIINGINWDYFPIGTNYSYSLWNQPDDFIKKALDDEMSLLKNMGINTIRVYTGIQPKWIKYIYENYGIYTMLNHSFGRYGLTINGAWTPVTDYRDEATQKLLMSEVTQMVEEYKNTPGLLLFLLGNENNYGLFGLVQKQKISQMKKTRKGKLEKSVADPCISS